MSIALPSNPNDAYVLVNRLTMSELEKDVAGGSNVTLTDAEAQYNCIVFSGILTGNIDVVVPSEDKGWDMHNDTSGAFTLTVKKSGGTGVAITQGKKVRLRYSTYDADVVAWTAEV